MPKTMRLQHFAICLSHGKVTGLLYFELLAAQVKIRKADVYLVTNICLIILLHVSLVGYLDTLR